MVEGEGDKLGQEEDVPPLWEVVAEAVGWNVSKGVEDTLPSCVRVGFTAVLVPARGGLEDTLGERDPAPPGVPVLVTSGVVDTVGPIAVNVPSSPLERVGVGEGEGLEERVAAAAPREGVGARGVRVITEVREEVGLPVEIKLEVGVLVGSTVPVPPPPPPSLAPINGVELASTLKVTPGEALSSPLSEGVGTKGERVTKGVPVTNGEFVFVISPLLVRLGDVEAEAVPRSPAPLELLTTAVREMRGEALSEGEEEDVFTPLPVLEKILDGVEVGVGRMGEAVESPPPPAPPLPAEAVRRMEGVSRKEAEEESDGILVGLKERKGEREGEGEGVVLGSNGVLEGVTLSEDPTLREGVNTEVLLSMPAPLKPGIDRVALGELLGELLDEGEPLPLPPPCVPLVVDVGKEEVVKVVMGVKLPPPLASPKLTVGATEPVLVLVGTGVPVLWAEAVPSKLDGVAREEMVGEEVLDTVGDPEEEGEPVGVRAITVEVGMEDRVLAGEAVLGGLLDSEGGAVEEMD